MGRPSVLQLNVLNRLPPRSHTGGQRMGPDSGLFFTPPPHSPLPPAAAAVLCSGPQ